MTPAATSLLSRKAEDRSRLWSVAGSGIGLLEVGDPRVGHELADAGGRGAELVRPVPSAPITDCLKRRSPRFAVWTLPDLGLVQLARGVDGLLALDVEVLLFLRQLLQQLRRRSSSCPGSLSRPPWSVVMTLPLSSTGASPGRGILPRARPACLSNSSLPGRRASSRSRAILTISSVIVAVAWPMTLSSRRSPPAVVDLRLRAAASLPPRSCWPIPTWPPGFAGCAKRARPWPGRAASAAAPCSRWRGRASPG
jgi:hypothetical protein